MKFAAYLNPQTAPEETGTKLWDGMHRLARTADRVGFDQISGGQHYLSDFTQLQMLPYLSRLSGEVEHAELVTGVVLLPFHHPVDLAERLATIDALHDNRIVFGIGAGYRDVEFDAFDVPKSERVPRTVECLELTTRLLNEESVTYDGDFWSVLDATIPVSPEYDIPVWMAANSNRAIERAARLTDAWYVNPHSTISEIRQQKEQHYDPVREERGEPTAVPLIREAFVAETRDEAVETAREYLWDKYQRYIDWGQDEAMEDEQDLHRPFDELAEDRFMLGTPAEVCQEIDRYEEELDASHIVIRSHWPGLEYDRAVESLELIGDEVIPNV